MTLPIEFKGKYYPEDDYTSFICLDHRFDRCVSELQNPNDVVAKGPLRVQFDYPFADKNVFTLVKEERDITRKELVTLIRNQYVKMYDEEKESTTLPVESIAERNERTDQDGPSLVNRAKTNGRWGIWGHCLGDLVLINATMNKENILVLGVDS